MTKSKVVSLNKFKKDKSKDSEKEVYVYMLIWGTVISLSVLGISEIVSYFVN